MSTLSAPCAPPPPLACYAALFAAPTFGVEMVPEPLRTLTLQKSMSPASWADLRVDTLDQAGHRCQACGEPGRLECHEEWAYDDQRLRQHFAGLWALCGPCHSAKTPGRLIWLERRTGRIAPGAHAQALARLDGWSLIVAEAYVAWCEQVNAVRGCYDWTPYARPHVRARTSCCRRRPTRRRAAPASVLAPAADVVAGVGSCCR